VYLIKPFEPKHVENLRLDDQMLLDLGGLNEKSPSYSGFIDGSYAFSAGIINNLGMGTVWVYTTPLIEKHPIWFTKSIKNLLNAGTDLYKFERVQATVLKENVKAQKWIEYLGFEKEGLMRKFIGGDHYLYARIT